MRHRGNCQYARRRNQRSQAQRVSRCPETTARAAACCRGGSMTHLDQEQLTLAYYGEVDVESLRHLDGCAECKLQFERIKASLDNFPEYPAPERADSYGKDVW